MPQKDSEYTIVVTDDFGCKDSATAKIFVKEIPVEEPCEKNIFVPNAFSPNNDGVNDFFCVYGSGIEELHLIVADRWGTKMFETFTKTEGWNGTFRGKEIPPGVYVYYLKVKFCDDAKLNLSHPYKKGSVTLLR